MSGWLVQQDLLIFAVNKQNFPVENRKIGNIGFFSSDRYMTITSRLVPQTPTDIEERHVEAAHIYLMHVPPQVSAYRPEGVIF